MEGKQGYAMDEREAQMRQIEELKMALASKTNLTGAAVNPGYEGPRPRHKGYPAEEQPDHFNVQSMVNLLVNDTRQLQEGIGELRARLSPILADRSAPAERLLTPPHPLCKMAAELAEAHATVRQCRELIELTLMQLDL